MARAPFRLGLTRDQLASFLQDFEQIKQFENLFQLVDEEVAPNSVTEATTLAGNANARAQQALDTLERIANILEALAAAPVEENNNSVATDYIDYNLNVPAPTPYVGRTFWDGGQTINVQQTLNVAGKVNEDNFYYIKADSTISKGQLVMFTGAVGSSGVLRGAPATGLGINDGLRLMGLAAENIATNGFGLVQWSGTLRGFNTTGAPYGETWADGDILYYNPSFAGGLTKVEPTAPNVRSVIAAVVNAGSGGSGSVVIRLSIGSVLGGTDSNVYINSLANDDLLQYDGVQQRWENHAASSVTVGAATNVAGGAANQIVYQTGIGATSFIVAPTVANTFLEWSGSAFQWSANPLGTVTSVNVSGGTTGLTFSGGPITTSGTITMAGTLDVDNGGTGQTTYTNGQLLIGNSTGNTLTKSTLTAGTGISISNGAGSITITNSAPDQIVSLTGAGTTVITGAYPSFTITSNDQFVGTVTSVDVSGGTTGLTFSGGPITTNGTITMAGTLDADNGGTGQSSYVIGDILYASSTTALSRLADVATGNALISGGVGVAPLWGKIELTTHVSGTLPVANGGTGTSTAFTAGSVIFAGASGVYAQDNANLFWDDTNNRLGIKITAPLAPIHIISESTTGPALRLQNFGTSIAAANETLGTVEFYSNDASVSATGVFGKIGVYSDAAFTGGTGNDAYMAFFTAADSTLAETMRLTSSGFAQFYRNLIMPYQPAQTTKAAAATLSGSELITGILQYTGGAATVNFPTGATIEGALTWNNNNVALDFFVINTGAGTCTMGANGNTTVGALTVAAATSAQFRIRRTAANTFTIYRLT